MAGQAETTTRLIRLRRASGMGDDTRRPTLRLKNAPVAAPASAPPLKWKCKPCGAPFEVDPALDGAEAVRCPACNARLGRAEQFIGDPADVQGVRARIA